MRKKATLIFILRFIRLAIAVLNLSLSAKYFGVSLERDVWLLALNCIIIFDMAIWGPLNETFRAKFLFIKEEEGEDVALNKTKSLLLFTNVITILLVTVILLVPNVLAHLLAPTYKGQQLEALVFMIRVVAPSFLINQITKLLSSILNAYNSFIIPELIGLFTQAFTLVLIITLASSIGILTLAIAYYTGLVLLLIFLSIQLKNLNVKLWSNIFQTKIKAIKPFFIFSLPFFFPYFTAQLNLILEKALASSLNVGAVSILDYSRRFSDIPLDVLVGILISLLVPVLSLNFAQDRKKEFLDEFRKIYQFGLLIVTIIVGMLTACPDAIVNILYKKGSISAESLSQISHLTMFYSWAAFGIFFYQIFGLALISSKKGKLYAIYGTLAQILMIIINLSFYGKYNIYTFPFSLLISHIIMAGIMARYFPIKDNGLKFITFKYGSVLLAIVLVMYALNKYLIVVHNQYLLIVINGGLMLLLLGIAMIILKLEEFIMIRNAYKKLISG